MFRISLLIVFLGFADVSVANESLRPHLRSQFKITTPQEHFRLPNARVAWVDFARLRADFPPLNAMTDGEVETWILDQFGYISQLQLRLRGIRSDEFPVDLARSRIFFHPPRYGRAAVAEATLNGANIGLIDLKGSGHADEAAVARQVRAFNLGDANVREKILTQGHSDGLSTFGENIAEVSRQRAVQATYDVRRLVQEETVEAYFLIDTGIQILKGHGSSDPSSIVGRQAHLRGHPFPGNAAGIYSDDHGGFQRSVSGASVDFGGVIPLAPELDHRFDLRPGGLAKNPQDSKAWSEGHNLAQRFREVASYDIFAARGLLYSHFEAMLGNFAEPWREIRFRRTSPSAVEMWRRALKIWEIDAYFANQGLATDADFMRALDESLADPRTFSRMVKIAISAGVDDPEFFRHAIRDIAWPGIRAGKFMPMLLTEHDIIARAKFPKSLASTRLLIDLHMSTYGPLSGLKNELRAQNIAESPEALAWVENLLMPDEMRLIRAIDLVVDLDLDTPVIRERLFQLASAKLAGSHGAMPYLLKLPPQPPENCALYGAPL